MLLQNVHRTKTTFRFTTLNRNIVSRDGRLQKKSSVFPGRSIFCTRKNLPAVSRSSGRYFSIHYLLFIQALFRLSRPSYCMCLLKIPSPQACAPKKKRDVRGEASRILRRTNLFESFFGLWSRTHRIHFRPQQQIGRFIYTHVCRHLCNTKVLVEDTH